MIGYWGTFFVGERQWFTQIHELETTWIYVSSVQGGPSSYKWSLGAPINDLIYWQLGLLFHSYWSSYFILLTTGNGAHLACPFLKCSCCLNHHVEVYVPPHLRPPAGKTLMNRCNIVEPGDTVDGSEIRRSPVEVGSLFQYLQGFLHPRWWSPDFWTISSTTTSE